MNWQTASPITTATDVKGLLIRVHRDGDGFMVRDFTGLRYGWAKTLVEAVEMWASEVNFVLIEPEEKLGGPLLAEVRRYKAALAGEPGERRQ